MNFPKIDLSLIKRVSQQTDEKAEQVEREIQEFEDTISRYQWEKARAAAQMRRRKDDP